MADTMPRPKSGDPRQPTEAAPAKELQIRIVCGGRIAPEVLSDLESGLGEAASAGRDPLIVLEDLGSLRDSVATLIKGISRMLVGYPRTVTFWETSGYTEAFLSVMEPLQSPRL